MNYINSPVIDNNFKQNTLKRNIHFSGVGVHNGRAVSMSIEPAKVNTGILFERIDLDGQSSQLIDNSCEPLLVFSSLVKLS